MIMNRKSKYYLPDNYKTALRLFRKRGQEKVTVFIIDNDKAYLEELETEINKNPKFTAIGFTSFGDFLNQTTVDPDLVLLNGKFSVYDMDDAWFKTIISVFPLSKHVNVQHVEKSDFIQQIRQTIAAEIVINKEVVLQYFQFKVENFFRRLFFSKRLELAFTVSGLLFIAMTYMWI